jgi:hypothetical protein
MALTKLERMRNLEQTLKAMLFVLGDLAARSSGFYTDQAIFGGTLEATWRELVKKQYVKIIDFVGGRPVCFLTGEGWLKAVALTGIVESVEFQSRVDKVMKNLKERVVGRETPAQVALSQLALDTGVPEGFIWNLIESNLMSDGEPDSPHWALNSVDPNTIEVPVCFGRQAPLGPMPAPRRA